MNAVRSLFAPCASLLRLAIHGWRRSTGGHERDVKQPPPFAVTVRRRASRRGAGWTLGDIAAGWIAVVVPAMVLIQLGWFRASLAGVAPAAGPALWFAMQGALLAGFVVSSPVSRGLIPAGSRGRT